MMAQLKKPVFSLFLFASLAACSPSGSNQGPVEITDSTPCDLDGMVLSEYPGPKAQLHYVDEIGQPLFFCDTTELFSVVLKPEQQRKVKAIYVQDMAQTDWDEPHGAWIDAKTAFYVVGSSRHGSMGPTIGSFSTKEAAEKFAAEFGGHVHPFSEITEDMSQLDGGALHDQMM